MVIAGDDQDVRFSNVIGSNADRLAMDGDGLLYIRLGGGAPGTTEVEVTDWTFRTSVTHNINQSGLEPLSAGPSVLWRKGDALFRFASPDVVGRLSHPDDQKEWIPEQLVNEVRFVFGFSGQRQVQIGTLSEQVVVRASDGKVLSRTTMALDDAYRLANQKVYQRGPLAGVSRVLWAGVSRNGELVICMSGLPLSGPAYVAIIDPLTGRALRVIAALLPSTLERIDRFNPQGVMFPARGAVDDRLVILDSLGILAVYKLQ
jgi:hypothetical protein